ncbi:MAG: hypothetical protein ACHQ2E_03615 [Gemmatimonadales bacterium]
MKRGLVVGAMALALTLGTAAQAVAQNTTTFGVDAAFNSAYFWRGVTYTNKPVLQPDVYLTFGSKLSVTGGGWANIELGQYNSTSDISEGGGLYSFYLTEFDWWGEANYPVGIATLTAGATGYIFPNGAGYTPASNTVEIYGKVALGTTLSPKAAVWYDVDKIKGAYFEFSVAQPIKLSPGLSLSLAALMGLSAGQGCDPLAAPPTDTGACTVSGNFYDNGVTHFDISAALPFTAGPISINPNVHGIIGVDDYTTITSNNPSNTPPYWWYQGVNTHDFKVEFGVTLSWSKAFGGAKSAE